MKFHRSMIPAGRSVRCQPILIFPTDQGMVQEQQPQFDSAFGAMHSRVAICPICGTPWAKLIMFTQSTEGPIKREFRGQPIHCFNPECYKYVLHDYDRLPLLQNIYDTTQPALAPKAFAFDAYRILKIYKPELLGEPAHDTTSATCNYA